MGECPYFGKGMCLSRLHTDALALLREKDAEIERLTKERNKAQAICVQMGKQHQQELAQVRADAITEFVNRVKANCAVQKVHYVKDDEATITYIDENTVGYVGCEMLFYILNQAVV